MFVGPSDCPTFLEHRFRAANLPLIEAAIAKGTVRYQGDAIAECTKAVEAMGCEFLERPRLEACEKVVAGTVAAGGECVSGEECEGDLYCKQSSSCPGSCSTLEKAGALCREDSDCEGGLDCVDGKCTAKPKTGETCSDTVDCGGVNMCSVAQQGKPRTCRAFDEVFSLKKGQTCDIASSSLCEGGLSCSIASVTLAGAVTSSCVEPVASGTKCNLAFFDSCLPTEYCKGASFKPLTLEGECRLLPTEGAACAESGGKNCAKDHACVNAKCQKLRENGDACTVDDECWSSRCSKGACIADSACAPTTTN